MEIAALLIRRLSGAATCLSANFNHPASVSYHHNHPINFGGSSDE